MRATSDEHTANDNDVTKSRVKSILNILFWRVLNDVGVKPAAFSDMIDRYISRHNKTIELRKISSVRGNLKKEFFKDTMTWRVFVKGLLILNIPKFSITLTLYHPTGKITTHEATVNFTGEESAREVLSSSQDRD